MNDRPDICRRCGWYSECILHGIRCAAVTVEDPAECARRLCALSAKDETEVIG